MPQQLQLSAEDMGGFWRIPCSSSVHNGRPWKLSSFSEGCNSAVGQMCLSTRGKDEQAKSNSSGP